MGGCSSAGGRGAGGVIGEGGGDADASGDGDRQSPLSPRFTPSFPIHATARISGDERERKGDTGIRSESEAAAAAAAEGKKL